MIGRLFSTALVVVLLTGTMLARAPRVFSAEPKGAAASKGGETAKETERIKFIRVVHDSHERPLALETATARYTSPSKEKPFTVDLIGAIHIADKDYFDSLNARFKKYDAVLFELVMPEGQSLGKLRNRSSSGSPIGALQESMQKMLDLEYQLKCVDYTAKNFVHADLSFDQMSKAMEARGDNGVSVFFKIFFDVIKESNRQAETRAKKGADLTGFELFAALLDPNRPLALKRLMADQMEMMGQGSGLGQTLDTILVQDRNGAAMKVLREQIAKGTRKIAIFYGAAHMPDFDKRLTEELKLRRESFKWDRAWDLSGK
jgi:hypothetical protein